jgi:hypothetical protein
MDQSLVYAKRSQVRLLWVVVALLSLLLIGFYVVFEHRRTRDWKTSAEELLQQPDELTAWISVNDGAGSSEPLNQAQFERFRDQQVTLIKSPIVCERAVANSEVSNLPLLHNEPNRAKWLQDHIEAFAHEQFIIVRLAGEDPTQAAKIVNAVVEEYLETSGQRKIEQGQVIHQLLTQETERKRKELEKREAALATLIKTTHADPRTQQFAADRYSSLCGAAAKVRELRLDAELRMASADVQLQQAESDAAITAKAKLDQAIGEAQEKVLAHAADEIKSSLAAIEETNSNIDEHLAEIESSRMEVEAIKASLQELLARRERLEMQFREPDRISVLRRAGVRN